MQIAKIVPKSRTEEVEVFDYTIPPALLAYLHRGSLVEIPFHGRRLEGVVVDLKAKSTIPHLQPISRLVSAAPVIDPLHLKLAEWISFYYLAPLGKTVFEQFPEPARSQIKNALPPPEATLSSRRSKRYLVIGDFLSRKKFYLAAIRQTLKQKQSVIILIPDLSLSRHLTQDLPAPFAMMSSRLKRTDRWQQWDKIKQGKVPIVIGSLDALFSPFPNLGLIIIDQEESESYKNDRAPRFHAVRTAETLAEISGANLILGTLTPRVESYYLALKNHYHLKKNSAALKPRIDIVDLGNMLNPLSQSLEQKIEENMARKKKIILVLNRKGEGTRFSCPDCYWQALCEKCGLPLMAQGDNLHCFRCDIRIPPPESCPKCQSAGLRSFGLGTNRLEKFVRDLWPNIKILRIEEGRPIPDLREPWDLAIVTSFALKLNFPPIGLTAIIDSDQALNFPDYHQVEKNFSCLYKFLRLAEQGIIQTNLPEHPFIRALGRLDYDQFFLEEMALRQKLHFPPYTTLIRLLYKNQNEERCREESEKLKKTLSRYLDSAEISGPSPAFYLKQRNFYRYHLILKLRHPSRINKLRPCLKTLPRGWTLDRDPLNLL